MVTERLKLMKESVCVDNLFTVRDDLLLMAAKDKIVWMRKNNFLQLWLFHMNGLQDGTPYSGRPIFNIPSVRFHWVWSRFILYW